MCIPVRPASGKLLVFIPLPIYKNIFQTDTPTNSRHAGSLWKREVEGRICSDAELKPSEQCQHGLQRPELQQPSTGRWLMVNAARLQRRDSAMLWASHQRSSVNTLNPNTPTASHLSNINGPHNSVTIKNLWNDSHFLFSILSNCI